MGSGLARWHRQARSVAGRCSQCFTLLFVLCCTKRTTNARASRAEHTHKSRSALCESGLTCAVSLGTRDVFLGVGASEHLWEKPRLGSRLTFWRGAKDVGSLRAPFTLCLVVMFLCVSCCAHSHVHVHCLSASAGVLFEKRTFAQ